ncbi:glucosamine-6-phosphate deaminase [Halomonas sp. KAO]|uniref:glucosamine-6-phosphate deaminase n=1 Tax=Halomonas sp. KAO TaxID=2783858 RepID=UPI00189F9EFC|nr:glucosamine-6-phosphate deaminase [Halomonas sp. KAO]MBF7052325.1 glucosamine-6-phosphate deaminase [Halomonas sp. KAO]
MYKIFETVDDVSRYTAQRLLDKILAKPAAVLGLATGGTMEPVYAQLVQMLQQQPTDLSRLTTFNLDEYIGLTESHVQSYRYYMDEHLFDKLNLPRERVHLPDGMAEDIDGACLAYSAAIQAAGGLDLQLLGIGSNGHIGFNEPYTRFSSRTHVIALSEQTRRDNGRFFSDQDEVPIHALTLGIQDILEAKEIMLVATGPNKAEVMAELHHSGVDEALPASALKQHDNVTIVLDREAAALLPSAEWRAVQTVQLLAG